MKPLLGIFLDGLMPESVGEMPFLAGLPHRRRIKSSFGYSLACHGDMYSGVPADRHKLWFLWLRSPETSPFRGLEPLAGVPFMNTVPGKLIYRRLALARLRERNTAFFGIPRFVHVDVRDMTQFDVAEKRMYDQPGYLTEVPSIFDILRKQEIGCLVTGLDRSAPDESVILERTPQTRMEPFTLWFIGDVDHFSHHLGQESAAGRRKLRLLDGLLERKAGELEAAAGPCDILVWSDHGHIPVGKKINLGECFSRQGRDLFRYLHVTDTSFARFWRRRDGEEEEIRAVLGELGGEGRIVEIEEQKRRRLWPGDNRYGDILFALHPGRIFSRTIWGWSRTMNSTHGYDPDHQACDGVVLSTRALRENPAALIDVAPTILEAAGAEIPAHMEGRSLWM